MKFQEVQVEILTHILVDEKNLGGYIVRQGSSCITLVNGFRVLLRFLYRVAKKERNGILPVIKI